MKTYRIGLNLALSMNYGRGIARGVKQYADGHPGFQINALANGFEGGIPRPSEFDGAIVHLRKLSEFQAMPHEDLPLVNVSNLDSSIPCPRVVSDDVEVGKMAARYYLDRGFTRFAFLGLTGRSPDLNQMRHRGFTEELEAAGRQSSVLEVSFSQSVQGPTTILERIRATPGPFALFAANDAAAGNLIRNCLPMDVRIPEEMAVLGVDNDDFIVSFAPTPISSIELDLTQIGYRAAETLHGILAGKAAEPVQLIPPVRVVTRESTRTLGAEDPLIRHAFRLVSEEMTVIRTAEALAKRLHVSRRTLERRIRATTGQTVRRFMEDLRLDSVRQLLAITDQPMGRIAEETGFADQRMLSVAFRKVFGLTPTEFRQQSRRASDPARREAKSA